MASFVDRVDRFQRKHAVIGFPLAVLYKFFDNQSSYLAAIISYYAFAAIFPLLLISSTILDVILSGHPDLKNKVLESALAQFPIVGPALGTPQGLEGTSWGTVAASLTALYGIIGLGQAAQNAVFVAWAIPRNSRHNPFLARFHSALFMLLSGFAVLTVALLTSLASNVHIFGFDLAKEFGDLVDLVSICLIAGVLGILVQVATPFHCKWRYLFLGSFLTGVMWQLLQRAGRAYVEHVVARASDFNALFAVVLGLMATIYVAATMAMIGLQVTVVAARRLWPRALLTPFTDAVELTDADERAYAEYAQAQRHKGFEHVQVVFHKRDLGEPDAPSD